MRRASTDRPRSVAGLEPIQREPYHKKGRNQKNKSVMTYVFLCISLTLVFAASSLQPARILTVNDEKKTGIRGSVENKANTYENHVNADSVLPAADKKTDSVAPHKVPDTTLKVPSAQQSGAVSVKEDSIATPSAPGKTDAALPAKAEQAADLDAQSPSATKETPKGTTDSILDVLVIGAGWAGIGAAHELYKKGPELQVEVLEAYHNVGGRSRTIYPFEGKAKGYAVEVGSAWTYKGTDVHDMLLQLPDPHYGQIHYDESFTTLGMYAEEAGDTTRAITGDEFDKLIKNVWFGEFAPFSANARAELHEANADKAYQTVMDEFYEQHGYKDTQEPSKLLEKRFIEAMVHAQLEIEHAGPLTELSTEDYGTSANACLFCDADYFIPVDGGGFDKIMKSLVDPVRPKILLNHTVSKIEYPMEESNAKPIQVSYTYNDGNGQSKEGIKLAKKVIITVPLGVLKKRAIEFVPPLPAKKQEAIDYIGFGILNKAVLYWDTNQTAWWPHGQEMISLLPENVEHTGRYNTFFNDMELGNGGHFVLSAWTGGAFAQKYEEEMSDEEIYQQVMQNLRSMFGPHVPEPTKYILSRWGQEPLAYGSYSWTPVGTERVAKDKRRDLREAIGGLYWAGEATSTKWFGTTVGALESGEDAVWELLGLEDE